MGAFLDKPKTDKTLDHGEANGLRFALSSMQGWRREMEDAHTIKTELGGALAGWSYFAVFDGHSGARVSAHCADNLLDAIVDSGDFQKDVSKGIHNGFLQLDSHMRDLPEFSSGEDSGGTTAVCAFISPHQIYVANCGDSRAMISRSGEPFFVTEDHKPYVQQERERIVKAGGSVMIQRVNGTLAVSRALGDYVYKNVKGRGQCEQLVSPEPEIFVRDRNEDEDEFMVLACDGIWDVMSNYELCQYIHSRLLVTDNLESVASQVIDTCLYKGSRDNMSIILVVFPAAPKPSPEAVQMEKELEDNIERRMKEILAEDNNLNIAPEFVFVVTKLLDSNIEGYPPGGGFESKRFFIEEKYKELCPDRADTVTCDPTDFQKND